MKWTKKQHHDDDEEQPYKVYYISNEDVCYIKYIGYNKASSWQHRGSTVKLYING